MYDYQKKEKGKKKNNPNINQQINNKCVDLWYSHMIADYVTVKIKYSYM